jgi:hypothetical protein
MMDQKDESAGQLSQQFPDQGILNPQPFGQSFTQFFHCKNILFEGRKCTGF